MFRRKRSVDTGMTAHAEMPEIGTDNPRMSRRQRRAAEKAAKREAMEAAKRHAAREKAAAKRKAAAKKKGARNGAKKRQLEKQNKRAISAQATIPYREMGKDGICRVHDRLYSKTIRYLDLNYQLAQPDDKADIFDGWSEFLNYFDYTIHAQLTFSNRHSIAAELENLIKVRPRNDGFSDLMEEYANMLREQLQKGNNGLIRTKYITYSIEADNFREAKPKLERIEADILTNFKVLGVVAYPLNGSERLKQMYEFFNPDAKVPFEFSYDLVLKSGMSTKDYIAPTSFNFKNRRFYRMGNRYSAVSYLQILASELSDKMLAEFLDLDRDMVITMHIQSIEQSAAIKMVKGKVSDINKMKIEEQKKAVRSGYDMDIIPSDLNTYSGEAQHLLDDLQSRNERLFLVTVLVLNTERTREELENAVGQVDGVAHRYNCALRRLDCMQEAGMVSSLPLGWNQVPIKRALTTTSTAIFVPFTTQELFIPGEESVYYGLNAVSNNMIYADRKQLKTPNGLILGTPGSGKSFTAKREIAHVFFFSEDDVIICDPEGEYYPLVQALGGQVVRIAPSSHDYINPLDFNLDYSDDENPLRLKSDFILSLCELIMGSRSGIDPKEKSVIDRCLAIIYDKYLRDPRPENIPILGDLYNCLLKQPEKEAAYIATALEIYVTGSLNVFNHQTNVELNNRIVCFDIKDLGKQLKKLGMLIVQDQVWNRVTINRFSHKATRYYIDEFHLLLKEEQTASYSIDIWKNNQEHTLPDVFTAVKHSVTARQVAEMYGIEVNSHGMACCPFHDDTHPSMKLDERYYCFGCHASGDAIDFVSNLFQIGKREAALKIAEDFHIPYDPKGQPGRGQPVTPEQKKEWEMRQLQKEFREWRGKALSDLNGDYRILTERAEQNAPTDPDTPFPQGFVQAYNDRTLVEFYIGLLETAPRETQINLYLHDRAAIAALDDRVNGRGQPRTSVREKLEEKKSLLRAEREKNTAPQKQRAAI